MNLTDKQKRILQRALYKRIISELRADICLPAWGNLAEKLLKDPPKTQEEDFSEFNSILDSLPINKKKK